MPFKRSPRREFERVALAHLDEIYRYACRLTRERALAEDLTQETFLQAWSSFSRFEAGTNCRAWLYRIFHNVHSHSRRHRQRDAAGIDLEQLPAHAIVYDPPLPRVLEQNLVEAAFADLGPEARELVLLADVEGFSYREIAVILGVPIGTVMSRLSRTRRRLRALITARSNAVSGRVSGGSR